MKNIFKQRNRAFYALLAVFALFILAITVGTGDVRTGIPLLIVLAIAFTAFGLTLVILSARLKEPKKQKVFFILTGASAMGIPVFAILHNVVYGLFMIWFGEGFWDTHGGDEPVCFIMAIIVCPLVFLVGTVGSIVILAKAKRPKADESAPTG